MQAIFKYELSESEVSRIREFCSGADYFAVEQSIGFSGILYSSRVNYFFLTENDKILSFCQINETHRLAHVWYGPVCNDRDLIIMSLNEIISHYKKRRFWYLGIQMFLKAGYDCDYIEYHLNRSNRIIYRFDNENTKASIEIDLQSPPEQIIQQMRKGHRSDIKKAVNSGITIGIGSKTEDTGDFISVYRKMCQFRSIAGHSTTTVNEIVRYLADNNQGELLVARDPSGKVIGGAVFAFQGISVRYLLSASDPETRHLPVAHLIIMKALERGRVNGFKYFDFWGYNHFADENDPAYNINKFKKGFGGYFTFFAKRMNISLVPFGYNIFKLFAVIKKIRKMLPWLV